MEISAKTIAEHLGGEIIGDPNVVVSSVARIENGKKGNICFLANPKYEHYLYMTKASIVLVNRSFDLKEAEPTIIRVDNAYEGVASLLDLLNSIKNSKKRGVSWRASVGKRSKISEGVYVGKFTIIGKNCRVGRDSQIYPQVYLGDNVTVGENTTIYPGVRIYSGCVIGSNCILHSNSVIGSDGFGFAQSPDGSYKKIPQTGNVVIEDDCEVGANCVIDRATMESTIIRRGVKLDNLIQIAHNVEVGENTAIAAQAGIAGSAKIGKRCQIGGQAGIVGHYSIADDCKIGPQSGVMSGIKKEGSVVIGAPAFDHKDFMKSYVIFKNLPKLNIK